MPQSAACSPVNRWPNISSSFAFAAPRFFVSIREEPISGIKPMFTNANTNLDASCAQEKSHARAMLKPPPATAPSSHAITGFALFTIERITSLLHLKPGLVSQQLLSTLYFMPFTSPPPQKFPCAPRITITRTSGESLHAFNIFVRDCAPSIVRAFSFSGLFMVIIPIPSFNSKSTYFNSGTSIPAPLFFC